MMARKATPTARIFRLGAKAKGLNLASLIDSSFVERLDRDAVLSQ